ncbi:MAG: hypothetical protein ACXWLM_06530 [Myxococcales bacterium]
MKAFLIVVVAFGLAGAALFAPVCGKTMWARASERGLPREAAKLTARGLRATWDFVFAQPHPGTTAQDPAHSPPRHASRKAQAAPAHRVSREGIVAQPPKEKISRDDRAALDALVRR